MDKQLEFVLVILSAVFVLYTAMIDPKASLTVAIVAIICLIAYRMMFNKKEVSKKAIVKKTVAKKVAVKKTAKPRSKKK